VTLSARAASGVSKHRMITRMVVDEVELICGKVEVRQCVRSVGSARAAR
jgi:hypothetical protein